MQLFSDLGRDKEMYYNDQCKEMEMNNKRGKTRDPFQKSQEMKGKM